MPAFDPEQQREIEMLIQKAEIRSSTPLANELIRIAPHFAWIFLAIIAAFVLYKPITDLIDKDRITKVTIATFSIELAEAKGRDKKQVEQKDLSVLDERASRMAEKLKGARILWIDDRHPNWNLSERRAFEKLGVTVDVTATTNEALKFLDGNTYDAAITDLKRESDAVGECQTAIFKNAGCDLLRKMAQKLQSNMPRTLVYAARSDPKF